MLTNWFRNITIRSRILAGFVVVLLIGTVSSIYGLVSVGKVGDELKTIAEEDIPMTSMITRITTNQLHQAVLFERALRLAQIDVAGSNALSELKLAESDFIKTGKQVDDEIRQVEALIAQAKSHALDEESRQKLVAIEQAARVIKQEHTAYEQHAEAIFHKLVSNNTANLESDVKKTLAEEKQLDEHVVALLKDISQFTEQAALKAEKHELQAFSTMTTLTVIGFIAGFMLAMTISRSITLPLNSTMHALNDIADGEGDLTQRLDTSGKDEITHVSSSFNRFTGKIESVVATVRGSVKSINRAIQEINDGNINLSQRTEEQASSLEETASSMEEMTGTVKLNAENSLSAREMAETNRQRATSGAQVIQQAVAAMSEINESSGRIAEIITTIDSIAFQTNLLALNAAVEAARAGDQGRGFAVVASEVRSLAQRSAESAKEIKTLIESSVDKVKAGAELVDNSGKAFDELIEGIEQVADYINEIAAASNQQAAGINQVSQAVSQMDEMTQQNAALVEEATAASRSLQDQSVHVTNQVAFFRVSPELEKDFDDGYVHEQKVAANSDVVPERRVASARGNWEMF